MPNDRINVRFAGRKPLTGAELQNEQLRSMF